MTKKNKAYNEVKKRITEKDKELARLYLKWFWGYICAAQEFGHITEEESGWLLDFTDGQAKEKKRGK